MERRWQGRLELPEYERCATAEILRKNAAILPTDYWRRRAEAVHGVVRAAGSFGEASDGARIPPVKPTGRGSA